LPTVTDRIDGEVLAAGGTLLKLMASADFDIFKHEPALDFRPQATDNVVLLPQMGWATIEGRIAMGKRVIINIKTFGDGHRPPDRVIGSMR
jgi:glyoxylate reductase